MAVQTSSLNKSINTFSMPQNSIEKCSGAWKTGYGQTWL